MPKNQHVPFNTKLLTTTILLYQRPHIYQRPPSVGMPRHALRRRAPRYTPERVSLGAGISIR